MGSQEECHLDWFCVGHRQFQVVGDRGEIVQDRVAFGRAVEQEEGDCWSEGDCENGRSHWKLYFGHGKCGAVPHQRDVNSSGGDDTEVWMEEQRQVGGESSERSFVLDEESEEIEWLEDAGFGRDCLL